MTVRIQRDEGKEAVLLCALKVLNHELERKQAVAEVLSEFRKFAIEHGIVIDNKFRNENEIAL